MPNLRILVLPALVVACIGVYVRYEHLRREVTELPRVRAALGQVGRLRTELSDLAESRLPRHSDAWTAACVKHRWRDDDGRNVLGKAYREDLEKAAGMIDQAEAAGALSRLYAPGAESVAQLHALGDWLHAETASEEMWTCANADMLKKLDGLKEIVGAHADCLGRITALEPVALYRSGRPVSDECGVALRARTLPEHAPATRVVTAADRAAEERTVPWGKPTDEVLKVLGRDLKETWFVTSPDGSRIAYVVKRDGKQLVIVDGFPGVAYDAVWTGLNVDGVTTTVWKDFPGGPVFSADSRHVAYQAFRDKQSFLVVDGEEGPRWDSIQGFAIAPRAARVAYVGLRDHRLRVVVDGKEIGSHPYIAPRLVFSPDGGRLAYVVKDGGAFTVFVDGRPGAPYAEILPPGPVFSPDGTHVAYQALGQSGKVVVVDGHETGVYEGLFPPEIIFSADSQYVAYLAERNRRLVAIVDGREEHEYAAIATPAFTADSRCYYGATNGGKWFMVVNGRESGPYDSIVDGIAVSPDGKHIAYPATDARGTHLVVDGRDGPPYEKITPKSPVFSPDAARIAYVASRGGKTFAVIDGEEGPAYDGIVGTVTFSPDSTRAAYFAGGRAGGHLVVNGKEDAGHEAMLSPAPLFSPDSRHVAYVARKAGKKVVVEDGVDRLDYQDIDESTLRYGPDSAHLAYAAWDGGWCLVVDRTESTRFAGFLKGTAPRFDAAGHVYALAQSTDRGPLTRLEITLDSDLRSASRKGP